VIDYRPITPADLDACVEVFYASDETLTASFNLPLLPRNPQALFRMFGHVSSSTPERAWLAEEEGKVVGFGMSAERGDLTFLAFLFILPSHQGRGVGRSLYERCVPETGYRATTIWSIQAVSASLYASNGLVPREPIYTFTGIRRTELPPLPPGFSLDAVDDSQLDQLDAEVLGIQRSVDHQRWQSWDRQPFALRSRSGLHGYGYAQSVGRLGPVVVRQPEHMLPLVAALMSHFEPSTAWMLHVPGRAAELFVWLLKAGMKFDGAPTIHCSTEDRIDFSRYLPGSLALP
jgi:GNAT superfamily N-acetyltransferase